MRPWVYDLFGAEIQSGELCVGALHANGEGVDASVFPSRPTYPKMGPKRRTASVRRRIKVSKSLRLCTCVSRAP